MYVPMILIGYDSRKDKFSMERYFNYIRPVVLQKVYVLIWIMKEIDLLLMINSFFLNLSDGIQCSMVKILTTMVNRL